MNTSYQTPTLECISVRTIRIIFAKKFKNPDCGYGIGTPCSRLIGMTKNIKFETNDEILVITGCSALILASCLAPLTPRTWSKLSKMVSA